MEITVACCLYKQWPANGWGGEYVARLKRAVARNLDRPHRFVCFADDVSKVPEGIEARPLKSPVWDGCLPKLYVYSPEAGLEGRVLLFDLDNVIVGSLDGMASYDGDFCVRGRIVGKEEPSQPDGDMISFRAETTLDIWERFSRNAKRVATETGGRERFFLASRRPYADLWQRIIPGQVVSYKTHCRGKGLPENARVVSFHGRPRPHEVDIDWVKEHWR